MSLFHFRPDNELICSACGGAEMLNGIPCFRCADQDFPGRMLQVMQLVMDEHIAVLATNIAIAVCEKLDPMMEKYGVDREAVLELVRRKLVGSEEEGMEKVAAGEHVELLKVEGVKEPKGGNDE